jgi:hypothetical protein
MFVAVSSCLRRDGEPRKARWITHVVVLPLLQCIGSLSGRFAL